MVIVGVTGGFGTGKTTIMSGLATRGAAVISADGIVHDLLVSDVDVEAAVRERFGPRVFSSEGKIDRHALALVVFDDDVARDDLEALLHPRVREVIVSELQRLAKQNVVAVEIPLLAESGWRGFDLVISVEAVDDVVIARAQQAGWTEADVRARQAAQLDDLARREFADVVVHNNEDDVHLQNELDSLWERILALPPRDASLPWPGPGQEL